jgi:hypothetical protein
LSAVKIHCELWAAVYDQNVISEGYIRRCRMFKDAWTCVRDEKRSGRPFVMSDDLVQSVDQKTCASQFWDLYVNFEKFYILFSRVHTECREWLRLWLFRAIPRIRRISQSHHMSNRWWNVGSICEC